MVNTNAHYLTDWCNYYGIPIRQNTEVFFVNERALVRPEFIINNNIYVDLVRKSDINERYKEICKDFSLSFGVMIVIPIETLPLLTEVTKQMFEQKYGINL